MLPITAIILTYNEELNIEKCLKSIPDEINEIFVVDSYSDDNTLQIIETFRNVRVFQNVFETHSRQWIWALENLPISNDWIFGLDSDHVVTPQLREDLISLFRRGVDDIDGIYVNRKYKFLGRWIKYGGYYPKFLLKIFRKKKVRIDPNELLDHHFYINGKTVILESNIIEENFKEIDISFWSCKHVNYSKRLANELIDNDINNFVGKEKNTPDYKTFRYKKFFYNLPLFARPLFYFTYRYFIRLGFLDGREGLIFHFLHAFWFRFLVDAEIYGLEKKRKNEIYKYPSK